MTGAQEKFHRVALGLREIHQKRWLGRHSMYRKVVGSVLGRGKCLGCRFGPWSGSLREATNQCFCYIRVFLSPFLSLPPSSLCKSSEKVSSGEGKKERARETGRWAHRSCSANTGSLQSFPGSPSFTLAPSVALPPCGVRAACSCEAERATHHTDHQNSGWCRALSEMGGQAWEGPGDRHSRPVREPQSWN